MLERMNAATGEGFGFGEENDGPAPGMPSLGLDGEEVDPAEKTLKKPDTVKPEDVVLSVENRETDAGTFSNSARTKVSVGEISTFTASYTGGTWSASGGTSAVQDEKLRWMAPEKPGTYVIKYVFPDDTKKLGQPTPITMTVVAPSSIFLKKTGEVAYPSGQHGSGMDLEMIIGPPRRQFRRGLLEGGTWQGPHERRFWHRRPKDESQRELGEHGAAKHHLRPCRVRPNPRAVEPRHRRIRHRRAVPGGQER